MSMSDMAEDSIAVRCISGEAYHRLKPSTRLGLRFAQVRHCAVVMRHVGAIPPLPTPVCRRRKTTHARAMCRVVLWLYGGFVARVGRIQRERGGGSEVGGVVA